jgi:nitrite reductase/ring-hydroxylating ferredoxin subunit/uncharacterized membrane protein
MQTVIRDIEGWSSLDPLSGKLAGWVEKVTAPRLVKNALSGGWLGHQLHPALTDVPIGAWAMATVVDAIGGEKGAEVSRQLVGVGILGAVPAAWTGASDWSSSYGPEQRVGLVHALTNSAGTLLQLASWVARRRGRHGTGAGLSAVGLGATGVAAYLGGHLTLVRGVGVNHTAFQEAPGDWTDVAAEVDLVEGTPKRVEAAGVPVMLVRRGPRVLALSAVCTHAGGPLDEGTLTDDDCVECPWHGSQFRLTDGAVERGPASVPEPVWEVRLADGRVSVRTR